MRIFVINLARRMDRMAHIRRQLDKFERIEAVDGNCVVNPNVAKFKFWCAKGYSVRPGEIGCVMSHQTVYRRIIKENIDLACVLEDDVTLLPGFVSKIEDFGKLLLTSIPMVITFGVTTAGYLINRSGAELMLKLNEPMRSTADDWHRWVRGGLLWQNFKGLVAVPQYGNPMAEGIAKSDIIGDARHFVCNKTLLEKILYSVTRIFGKAMDWCMEVMP